MNKELRIPDYLEHIVAATDRIFRYVQSMSRETFFTSEITQDAVVRNLENIGEAARNILRVDPGFSERHPQFPLTRAIGMRNTLAHGYFGVKLDIVWEAIEKNLPDMALQARNLISKLGEDARTKGDDT